MSINRISRMQFENERTRARTRVMQLASELEREAQEWFRRPARAHTPGELTRVAAALEVAAERLSVFQLAHEHFLADVSGEDPPLPQANPETPEERERMREAEKAALDRIDQAIGEPTSVVIERARRDARATNLIGDDGAPKVSRKVLGDHRQAKPHDPATCLVMRCRQCR